MVYLEDDVPFKYIALSADGVPESKQSGRSLDVITLRYLNCKMVLPLTIIRRERGFKLDVATAWDDIIAEINRIPLVRVHHLSMDAPKRAETLCFKGHGGYQR